MSSQLLRCYALKSGLGGEAAVAFLRDLDYMSFTSLSGRQSGDSAKSFLREECIYKEKSERDRKIEEWLPNGGTQLSTMLLPWLELVFLVFPMLCQSLDGIFKTQNASKLQLISYKIK
ncbi:uncharacterized protein LOC114916009 [Cajanus cajan]|uniref:uncharacterized protein LOC114916009 n=1 Tax=Cajanus cajan TaxID=3821 RepID=UPI0010FAF2C7|nr:uncharacterized protein LOC114916009 [Cajanus cajan]